MKRFHPSTSAKADRPRDGCRIGRPVEAKAAGTMHACREQDGNGHSRRAT